MSGTLPLQPGDVCTLHVVLPTHKLISVTAGIVRWVRGEDYGIETRIMDRKVQTTAEPAHQQVHEKEMRTSCQTGWAIRGILLVYCILFSVSCASKGSPVGAKQAQVPTAPKAIADGVAPGSKAYLALVQQRIRDVWKAPPLDFTSRSYVSVVQFRLHKDGSVSRVKIEESSGNESYDSASKQAVLTASPLPPFPSDISHAYLDAHITMKAP